ncbi:hypothetical protein JOF56_002620 [Kibdelosporangium banguiense]|uniref:Uncharacterized protein n=1 Tax=Kibdelosporangium banguiense TaxID=1365924 RepID=A0ABS4TDU1_9PSEU|nr:hypothetical protein [Kibdelosporangium banguiense]
MRQPRPPPMPRMLGIGSGHSQIPINQLLPDPKLLNPPEPLAPQPRPSPLRHNNPRVRHQPQRRQMQMIPMQMRHQNKINPRPVPRPKRRHNPHQRPNPPRQNRISKHNPATNLNPHSRMAQEAHAPEYPINHPHLHPDATNPTNQARHDKHTVPQASTFAQDRSPVTEKASAPGTQSPT